MKVRIIYWTGTGNTEEIARLIEKGASENYQDVKLLRLADADRSVVDEADILVLGSPSMGDEVIEESEMEPFMESIEDHIKGKKLALFGSYGWGDGQWMRDWEERVRRAGADLISEGLKINYAPDDSEEDCINFGKNLK